MKRTGGGSGTWQISIDEPMPLQILAPRSVEEAIGFAGDYGADSAYLAGGCDLIDQIKNQWYNPRKLINLKGIAELRGIQASGDGLSIGPLTTLAELARNADARQRAPALVQAALRVATPQIRNLGTVGGNLLQDSRCPYYRGPWQCYRAGGIVCDAHHGINEEHAIFGGDRCYTVTPSDLAPVMVALGATVHVQGRDGARQYPADALFLLPTEDIHHMHRLYAGELLTLVDVPLRPGQRSAFVKYTMRNVWDFSLASVAVTFEPQDGVARNCRVVFGAVAATPWRHRKVEGMIEGQRLTPQLVEDAAQAAADGAEPLEHNGYKVGLVRKLVRQSLTELTA